MTRHMLSVAVTAALVLAAAGTAVAQQQNKAAQSPTRATTGSVPGANVPSASGQPSPPRTPATTENRAPTNGPSGSSTESDAAAKSGGGSGDRPSPAGQRVNPK
jgi:hypothetical protein